MLHVIDADGRLLAVSDLWLEKLGYARADVIGRNPIDFLTAPSRRHAREDVLPAFLESGRCDAIEYEMVRRDGAVIEVLLSARLERDTGGQPVRSISVMEDITARRRAERALFQERQRLANIIEATESGTWEWHVPTGELRVNDRWPRMLGWTVAELAPITYQTRLNLIHPDDRDDAMREMARHLAGATPYFEMEKRMRHRDGRDLWVHSRAKVMSWTADGAPEWVFGNIKDVTARKQQEAALRTSQAFLERTGRVAGIAGWEIELPSRLVRRSAEAFRLLGWPPDANPTLEQGFEVYEPEARAIIDAALERAIATGEGWDLELPARTMTGRRIWARTQSIVELRDGKPARIVGAFHDVTDAVERRLALQEAHERITLATEGAGIGVWDWDIAADRVVWDARMCAIYGVPPDQSEPPLAFLRGFVHPDDLEGVRRATRAALDGTARLDTEFRIVRPDSEIRYIRASGQVSRDAAGQAVRMVGIGWDVTEQRMLVLENARRAEREAEAAERERALFNNSADALVIVGVTDAEGDAPAFVYEAASPSNTAVIGCSPDQLVGRRPEDCFAPAIARSVIARYRDCIARGSTLAFSETYDLSLGKRDFEGVITPIRHPTSGRITRLAGTVRDVTERNRMQAALHHGQKMEAIGRLAAGVAHDFNNILQSISGGLELALDVTPPESVEHEMLSIGLRSARRGSNLTHHLLAYARKQLLRPGDVAIPALLSDVATILDRTLGPSVTIRVRCADDLPDALADQGQLQTALLNLAINAAHAMPRGGALAIDARHVGDDGRDWVLIAVKDTGTGMDAETLARAVEPFFTTKGLNGTGLGLSMVQGFVEQSGGRFRIASTPGAGTTVELLLPATRPGVRAPAAAARAAGPMTGRVLLVDDDADVMVTTAAFLEKAGFVVARARDANEALALLAGAALFDAIVTDFAMPGMNGLDLIATARERRPNLPAIVISGFVEVSDATPPPNTIRLHKPFERTTLIAAVNSLVTPAANGAREAGPAMANSPG